MRFGPLRVGAHVRLRDRGWRTRRPHLRRGKGHVPAQGLPVLRRSSARLQQTAPYLIQLDREDRFTRYLIETGWGASWGSFVRTETGIKQLRRHLKEFLRVRDEAGKRLIFRYYDPRVLRVYLPTCRPAELDTFFGPINAFITEGSGARRDSGIPAGGWRARVHHARLTHALRGAFSPLSSGAD